MLNDKVYNFMAQKDNQTNIALARDSRLIAVATQRDSTAMRTIALLTLLFLPGTYVAVLLALSAPSS